MASSEKEVGSPRVEIEAPPELLKVAVSYSDGYRCVGRWLVSGPDTLGKAQKAWSFASAADRDWVFGKTALELYPKLKD